MLADRLPTSLLDGSCTGGWVLDSVVSQADPPTTEASDSHLSLRAATGPGGLRRAPQQEGALGQAGLPEPSMPAMDVGSRKIFADGPKPLLFSLTLMYTLSCHVGQEQREGQEI